MIIKDGRYFALVLFVYGDHPQDCLVHVYRDPGEAWVVAWRFRYYVDGLAHDSEDEKHAYCAQGAADMTEAEACEAARKIAALLMEHGFNDVLDVIEPKTDEAEKVFLLMTARPWCHARAPEGMAQA